jgi:hypothetical protein
MTVCPGVINRGVAVKATISGGITDPIRAARLPMTPGVTARPNRSNLRANEIWLDLLGFKRLSNQSWAVKAAFCCVKTPPDAYFHAARMRRLLPSGES